MHLPVDGNFRGVAHGVRDPLFAPLCVKCREEHMTKLESHKTIAQPGVDAPVHRRSFQKADGRMLHLYGYDRHLETSQAEQSDDVAKGGHLRWHPLRREWNIYASHRQNRTFKPSAAEDPLAPTKPGARPTEIPFSTFELAVFENKFTSLHPAAEAPAPIEGVLTDPAKGVCEVVVYSPEAAGNMTTIGQAKRRLLVTAWIDRYQAHLDADCAFVLPFENRGDEVGVTLHHPHGQLYGFPYTPPVQAAAARAFRQGYNLSADLATLALDFQIAQADGLVAFCPPFAKFPFEVWIAPRERLPGPWAFSSELFDAFAHLLGDVCRRYDAFFERETPYMMTLHAAPRGEEQSFHFTTQFYPVLRASDRVKYFASVEQSTGAFTVDVMPETAAAHLKVC